MNYSIIHFSINYLIFKKLQTRMKQWWLRCTVRQLIVKSIILLLLLCTYFNYAVNQLINQLLFTSPSQFHLHVLHDGITGRRRRPSNVVRWRICYLFIYLFGMGVVFFECTSTCFVVFGLAGNFSHNNHKRTRRCNTSQYPLNHPHKTTQHQLHL